MIFIILFIIIGLIGGAVASSKGRSFFGWFIICFFTGGIGILFLLFLSSTTSNTENVVNAINENTKAILNSNSVGYDQQKWENLTKYDAEIASAVARLRQSAPQKEPELAKAFFSIGDKSYLNAIVDRLISE